MGLLDELLEKKDLYIYIDERIKYLKNLSKPSEIVLIPEKKRNTFYQRIKGEIRSLRKLKHYVSRKQLRKQCKIYWEKNRKWD